MDELAQLLIEVERHYELMDEYSYQYPDKAIEDCMGQKQYPMIISEEISDGQSRIQTKEEDFIQKLDDEKSSFIKSLQTMKTNFTKIKTFKDP